MSLYRCILPTFGIAIRSLVQRTLYVYIYRLKPMSFIIGNAAVQACALL